MHNDFYTGSSISDNAFLMHYGVKGMKWGVRKRLPASGMRPHSAGYARVRKKLARLTKEEKEINKVQKAWFKGKYRKVNKLYKKASEKLTELNNNANRDYQRGQNAQMKEDQSRMFWWSDDSGRLTGLGLRGNSAVRVMNRMDGRKSKKLISDQGHAEAVKARNQYARHMAKMFAGTKYDKQTKAAAKKRMRVQR